MSSNNPEQDVWVRAKSAGMTGPCDGNLMAGQDDCMYPEEFVTELISYLQIQIGRELLPISSSGEVWNTINKTIESRGIKLPPGTFGIIVGDSDAGGSYGKVYLMVEN